MAGAISFSGLATGIDYDQLIEAMMTLERRPIDALEQRIREAEWKKELFQEIQGKMATLKDAAKVLTQERSLYAHTVTVTNSGSATDTFLTATAESSRSVAAGTYTVEEIASLATSTRVTSGFATALGIGSTVDETVDLFDSTTNYADFGLPVTEGYFTVNGVQIQVSSGDSLQDVLTAISTGTSGAVTGAYNGATDKVTLTSASAIQLGSAGDTSNFLTATYLLNSSSGATRTSVNHLGRVRGTLALDDENLGGTLTAGPGQFKINGVAIDYDTSDDTVFSVVRKINNSSAGVIAAYDTLTDKIVLISRSTGNLDVSREDVSGNLLEVLGLLDSSGDSQAAETLGANAQLKITGFNGGDYIYSTSNSIANVIPGVTLNLLKTTTDDITVKVERTTDNFKGAIETFVEKYNDLISLLHQRMTEEAIEDPETDEERKVGLLRGNQLLARVQSDLVRQTTGRIDGLPDSLKALSHLGVHISDTDYRIGKLEINQTTLTDQLTDNFDGVFNLFFYDKDNNTLVQDTDDGVGVQLKFFLEAKLDTTRETYGSQSYAEGDIPRQQDVLNDAIARYERDIENLEQRLAKREETLIRRFITTEQAVSRFQSLGASLVAYQSSLIGQG